MALDTFHNTFLTEVGVLSSEKHYMDEIIKVEVLKNEHYCKSVSKEGKDITHTTEMVDGRLFLYCATESSEYDYFQINNCPFCGFKAKKQI